MSLKKGGLSNLKPSLRKTRQSFIEESKKIHGEKYIYDLVIYVRNEDYVIIECKKHGYFLQTPKTHLKGRGCAKCGGEKRRLTTEIFIEKASKIHGDRYDYSLSKYVKKRTPIIIMCKKHGFFSQNPSDHLAGSGCTQCSNELTSWSRSDYKEIACKHNGKSKVYLIKMEGNDESFFKIGITVSKASHRFWGEKNYKIFVISEIEMEAEHAWEKEKELHKFNKKFKYKPKIKFGGHTECFSKLTPEVLEFFGADYAA